MAKIEFQKIVQLKSQDHSPIRDKFRTRSVEDLRSRPSFKPAGHPSAHQSKMAGANKDKEDKDEVNPYANDRADEEIEYNLANVGHVVKFPSRFYFDDKTRPGMSAKIVGLAPTEDETTAAKESYDSLVKFAEPEVKLHNATIDKLEGDFKKEMEIGSGKLIMRAMSMMIGEGSMEELKAQDLLFEYTGFAPLDIIANMVKASKNDEKQMRKDVANLCHYVSKRGTKFTSKTRMVDDARTKMNDLMNKYIIKTTGKPGPYDLTLGRISNLFPQMMF